MYRISRWTAAACGVLLGLAACKDENNPITPDIVFPDSSVIRLFVHAGADEALLSADGRVEALLKPPAEITVRRAGHSVRLVRMQGRTYFDVLRAKLLWGQDVRSVQGGENVPKA